jgi:Zn-dependent metalloprotease
MKTRFTFILVLITFSLSGTTQDFGRKTIIRMNEKGIIQSVEFSSEDQTVRIPASADEFFRDLLNIQPADQFENRPHQSKREEFIHEHFQQYHNGIRVSDGGYNFHYRNGEMFFAHGNYVRIDGLNTKSAISSKDAIIFFAQHLDIPLELVNDYLLELIIKEISLHGEILPMLVYEIMLDANHANNTEIGFVDAQTGEVVLTERNFVNFSELGRFETRYSSVQFATTYNDNGVYRLTDETLGRATIHTWNADNNWVINPLMAFRNPLTDDDNNWTQAEHRPNDNDMGLDVHWALQHIRDRLFDVHGFNSYDDNGYPIEAFIRHNTEIYADNASWLIGTKDKAMAFGAGYEIFHPLASVDIVAHEFGHGINHFQIGWGTKCPHNEGIADIFGVIMNYRIVPDQSPWLVASEVMRNHSCERNIENPTDPDARTQIACTFNIPYYNANSTCCHLRGGVFSRWFYLLVNGGSGINALGNEYAVDGVDMDVAEELIVEAVFNNYLRNTSDWNQILTSFIQVARALNNGQYGNLTQQVENAWYAVGVGCPSSSTMLISGNDVINSTNPVGTYQVANLPTGASIMWSHSNHLIEETSPIIPKSNLLPPPDLFELPPYRVRLNPSPTPPLPLRAWVEATVSINGYSCPSLTKTIELFDPPLPPIIITFSPNPTNDKLTIDFISEQTDESEHETNFSEVNYTVKLYDNAGVVHRQKNHRHRHRRRGNHQQKSSVEFNVSNLREGTYYLHIEGNGKIEKYQIIITP